MKRIDASKDGIFDIAWSKDSTWLTYLNGAANVRMANIESGEIREIGQGTSPGITDQMGIVLERNDEIVLISGKGEKTLVSKKDLLRDAPKRGPVVSPAGDMVVGVACNVFDKESELKNAYAFRHFLFGVPLDSGKPFVTGEQWYGGTLCWFPDGDRLAHFEFDSTAGPQTHIVSKTGERLGSLAGMYPAASPDGKRIAVRPRAGGSLVVYSSKETWGDQDVETSVMRIPAQSSGKVSANPPVWLDTRFVLLDEGQAIWRIDTKRDKAEEMKKIPLPVQRRKRSMVASPNREWLALEVPADEGTELRVLPLGRSSHIENAHFVCYFG